MKNYQYIRDICYRNSELSSAVIDEFLIYFAAHHHKLDRENDRKVAAYRHIARDLPEEWVDRYKAQYIAHRVFKKSGLIRKYINHSELRHFSKEEMDFLRFQQEHPWRFSFAEIKANPEPDFFEMVDILTGEEYLLFSPGIASTQETYQPILWFNLISFNGECMQTFGPVGFYNGFEPDDIVFFATELNRGRWFEDGGEVMEDVEANPTPYALLISAATLPLVFNKENQIVQITVEYHDDNFDTAELSEDFKIEYNHGIYKLTLRGWSEFPHFSSAYFDEKEEILLLNSMTDQGFRELVNQLNKNGYQLSYAYDRRVNMTMVGIAGTILKKKIKLTPYDDLFSQEKPDDDDGLEGLNAMLGELIPYVNSGKKPDFNALAAQYGVEPETVREFYEQTRKMIEGI